MAVSCGGRCGASIPRYVSQKRKPGTPKRQWRDNSQSLYGRQFDPLKDGELNLTVPRHEGNGENVWKEEEIDEKEQLVNLIDDFHSQYLSIYRRYDHLIEALRKKAGGKHGTESSSSGAYFSDSDGSPAKHSAKNDGLEKSPEKDIDGVLQEFEMALGEVAELMKKLAITTREKDALNQENANALSKLHESQKIVTALNAEAEKWNDERSRLLTENDDLKGELARSRNLQAELSQKLEDKDAERHWLNSEIRPYEEVETMDGRLQLERDAMQLKLESISGESSILREKLEFAENELAKQSRIQQEEMKHKESKIQEVESVKEENSTLRKKLEFAAHETMKHQAAQEEVIGLSSRISQLQEEIKQKENKIQVLVTESNRLSEALACKERELSHRIENFEAHKEAEKAKLESAEEEVAKVNHMVKAAEMENRSLSLKMCQLEDEVKQSEKKIQHLVTETRQLNAKLDDKESDILILRERVWKLENTSRELEKNMKEKEETILDSQEEKREAIRQLCVWIDHHRNRSDYYKKRLLEMNSNRETRSSVG